jgi:antitoxin VapB
MVELQSINGRKADTMTSLNIKNEETYRLVKELADKTGESMTEAVTVAVSERLDRIRVDHSPGLAERLLAIGEHCTAHLNEPWKSIDIDDYLYDELGLPK